MKKTTLAILSLFAALSLSVSCGRPAENTKSLLWKISGNGLEQPSYLFGTWHGDTELRGGSFLDSVPHFYRAFDAAQAYVGEVVVIPTLQGTNTRNDNNRIPDYVLLPGDTTYKDLLDAERLTQLDSLLFQISGNTTQDLKIRPSVLLFFIRQDSIEAKVNTHVQRKLADLASRRGEMDDSLYFKQRTRILSEKDVMDVYLQKYALQQSKELIGLDDMVGSTPSAMYSLPISHQEAAEALIDFLSGHDTLDYMNLRSAGSSGKIAAYRAQDLSKFQQENQKILHAYDNKIPSHMVSYLDDVMKEVSTDRTRKWMEVLPGIMQEQSAFVAVGVGHLGGPDGLIDLLRRAGYTVEPVL